MVRIGWGITGAGHLLAETFAVMEKLAKTHKISCFVSSASEKVIRMYGLWSKLSKICPGGYYRELILETAQGTDSPLTGRFLRKTYRALIVSPASANTVAKVVTGISDTLVTNAIAQAEKGEVQILILPTDQKPGKTKTKLPYLIDRTICEECERCSVIALCPVGAIVLSDGLPKIDLSRCNGCGICIKRCPHGAVSFGKEVSVMTRKIDVENVDKLKENKNFIVLSKPREIQIALRKVIGGRSE